MVESLDLAAGSTTGFSSEGDLKSPEIGHYVDKYLRGVECVPTEDRIRVGRLIENMTGGTALVESMHGAGSPQAQRIMIARQGNLQAKKQMAKEIAGIQN